MKITFKASILTGMLIVLGMSNATPAMSRSLDLPETLHDLYKYHDKGQYQHDYHRIMMEAIDYLKTEAPKVKHPAVVMDVDETIISNWPELKANQFAFFEDEPCNKLPKGPCGDSAWAQKGIAKVFPEAKEFMEEAKKLGVPVFLITGKFEKHRAALERNLRNEGFTGYKALYMRPNGDVREAMSFKLPIREKIEKSGYEIIENIGDQATDLVGAHSGRGFMVPNPFYRVL